MYTKIPFEELIHMARNHMEETGHSYTSVANHMRSWRSVYNYAISKGISCYSAELAERYMIEKYGLSIGEQSTNDKITPYMRNKIRALRALTDFMLHGYVPKEKHGEVINWPKEYKDVCLAYLDHYRALGYEEYAIRRQEVALCRFVNFLYSRDIEMSRLNAEHLYEYFKTITHYSKSSLVAIRSILVHCLDYFYENGYVQQKISAFVPRVHYYAKAKLNKVWSNDEITKILDSIDTANPVGKRDYAIIAIAAEYGLREGDIISLTINNFNWNNGVICLTQEKTGESLTLPLSERIGKAVIDYWMNGRPNTVTNEIFVTHTLPFKNLCKSSVYQIFNKYAPNSGYVPRKNERHGLHTLRHSLASRLLENEVPINVISNILGHVDSNETSTYLRIDIESLRACSLEVPGYE